MSIEWYNVRLGFCFQVLNLFWHLTEKTSYFLSLLILVLTVTFFCQRNMERSNSLLALIQNLKKHYVFILLTVLCRGMTMFQILADPRRIQKQESRLNQTHSVGWSCGRRMSEKQMPVVKMPQWSGGNLFYKFLAETFADWDISEQSTVSN